MAVLIVAGWFAECVIRALIRADALRARFGVSLSDELRIQVPLGAAVGACAVLIALAAEAMGLVALALLIAPLLVTQTAFRRYAGIRSTYLQTVGRAGPGHRGRRLRRGRALAPGGPARRRGRPGARA